MLFKLTRGIKNNNPFNIDFSDANAWQGKQSRNITKEPRFEVFQNAFFGIRAGVKLLCNYINKDKLTTVSDIIAKYAPSSENNTNAYIAAVAKALNVKANAEISADYQTLFLLTKAIIEHENGCNPYPDKTIKEAINSLNIKEDLPNENQKT